MKKRIIMSFCHPERKERAKGLCSSCYSSRYHKTTYPLKDKNVLSQKKKQYNSKPDVKERVKNYDRCKLLAKHGLTIEDYEILLAEQGYVCAICRTKNIGYSNRELLYIDHDHRTGEVRGLLCNNCNFGVGHFKDSPELLEAAAQYLRDHLKL